MEKPADILKETQEGDVEVSLSPDERLHLTQDDNDRIRRKTDVHVLTILVWTYFLQIFDKAVFGTAALFHMQKDTGLTGAQFSLVASISSIAQLAWQPFSSWLIVRVPPRILMPALVLGWGIAEASIAAGHSFGTLLAARFFLGLFEAGCLPLFSVLTTQWYRRVEQPSRVAAWYCNNGIATIVAGVLAYGLGHIPSDLLKPWQIIFLFAGLLTIITAPVIYWKLDNNVASARFFTPLEKLQAQERLRANQTGIGSDKFKWSHIFELAIEPKSYLWIGLALLLNIGASVTGTFGPLILSGFGFDAFQSSLLNMPFGAVQLIVILLSSWITQKFRLRFATLAAFMLPVVAGSAMLYGLPRDPSTKAALLAAYYMLAFLFAGNTLLISWMASNTAGATKSAATMALYQIGSSTGNIIGPLLFNSNEAPLYHRGLTSVLGVFLAFIACVFIQFAILLVLNKLQAKKRVRNGKSAVLRDLSMAHTYENFDVVDNEGAVRLGDHAFEDLTDAQNDECCSVRKFQAVQLRTISTGQVSTYLEGQDAALHSSLGAWYYEERDERFVVYQELSNQRLTVVNVIARKSQQIEGTSNAKAGTSIAVTRHEGKVYLYYSDGTNSVSRVERSSRAWGSSQRVRDCPPIGSGQMTVVTANNINHLFYKAADGPPSQDVTHVCHNL